MPEWALVPALQVKYGRRAKGRESQGLEGEGEERLNLFFLYFLDLPNFDDDLDDEPPREQIFDRPQDRPWDPDQGRRGASICRAPRSFVSLS